MHAKVLLIGAVALALSIPAPSFADTPSSPVAVKVTPALAAKASSPTPAPGATKKKGIGKGKLAVSTANSADDDDSFWVEQIDIDGDGTVEDANIIWDDEDKVLYTYAEGDFTCANGKTGSGGMIIAIFAAGNTGKKPAGSGWYAVDLDEGECGAKAAGVYGCRFDAKQQPTACGVATIDEKHDEITIVMVSN